jgi:hypothetical protein
VICFAGHGGNPAAMVLAVTALGGQIHEQRNESHVQRMEAAG